MLLKGRFSAVVPGSISQFTQKNKGVVFVTHLGAFVSEKDASLVFKDKDLSAFSTIKLTAEIATPLLEILGESKNAFYNVNDLDEEYAKSLFDQSDIVQTDERDKKRKIDEDCDTYERGKMQAIERRLLEFEEEQKRRFQRMLFRAQN